MTDKIPNDAVYKSLFSNKSVAASLIKSFVSKELLAHFDLSQMETVNPEYESENLIRRQNDMVWRIARSDGTNRKMLVMLEFQSSVDKYMAGRINEYAIMLVRREARQRYNDIVKANRNGEKLQHKTEEILYTPVLSLTIYTGAKKWNASMDLKDLFDDVPQGFMYCEPLKGSLLIDVQHLPKEVLNSLDGLVSIMFRFERSHTREEVFRNAAALLAHIKKNNLTHLRDILKQYAKVVVLRHTKNRKMAEELRNFMDMQEEIPGGYYDWDEEDRRNRAEAKAEGRAEGELLNARQMLTAILQSRFQELSKELLATINSVDSKDKLLSLVPQAVQAPSPDSFAAILAQ